MTTLAWVNIGSGNGLLPGRSKPLTEPTLNYYQRVWCGIDPREKWLDISVPKDMFEIHTFEITDTFPMDNELMNYLSHLLTPFPLSPENS